MNEQQPPRGYIMNINQHVPAGFTSWTEYHRHNRSIAIARTWIDSILVTAVLLLAFSIDSIVDAIL